MTNDRDARTEIFDLGYRHYDGPRLGRRSAIRSLIVLSLRNVFGLGRGALPKVLAFGLTLLAFGPAIAQVILGAVLGPIDFEVVRPEEYFSTIQVALVLFVASMSSELVGNDRKNNTLVLYFSRPIERDDYVLAKVAALTIALLALTLLPQLLMFAGNWLGAADSSEWFADNASDLFGIVVASLFVTSLLASVGVLIASFASRRAFAMISVIAFLLFSSIATSILVDLLDRGWAAAVMVLSPLYVIDAVTLVLFGAVPAVTPDSANGDLADQVAYADLPGWVWIAALLAQTVIAVALAARRYRRSM